MKFITIFEKHVTIDCCNYEIFLGSLKKRLQIIRLIIFCSQFTIPYRIANIIHLHGKLSYSGITCSKLIIETLKQGVKYVQS